MVNCGNPRMNPTSEEFISAWRMNFPGYHLNNVATKGVAQYKNSSALVVSGHHPMVKALYEPHEVLGYIMAKSEFDEALVELLEVAPFPCDRNGFPQPVPLQPLGCGFEDN